MTVSSRTPSLCPQLSAPVTWFPITGRESFPSALPLSPSCCHSGMKFEGCSRPCTGQRFAVPVERETRSVGTDAKVLLCSATGLWGCPGTQVTGTRRSPVPWLGWQGLTEVLCSVCHNTVGSGRAVLKARQDFKNSPIWPELPWSSPLRLGAGALRALVSPPRPPGSSGTSVTGSPVLASLMLV